eukprot:09350.XXX_232462_231136_1 [CDS] Oithona nana genome sequencing.
MAFSQVDCSKCFLFPQNRVSILEQQRNIVLLMLGLDNAGKTCTAKMLVGEDLETVAPTIGFSKVSTKYKGFNVTIYDLGGSKSFRGIWPKYYHEVHGFIFVVDSADDQRLDETAEVFQDILKDDKVKGKPILMLCNKADIEEAKDEVHVVNVLNVEKLVNVAKCPTRVEPSIATKNNGIKDGFKWLVKSVIANIADLGPRIVKDVEEEEKKEAIRKEELRKRLEEEKMLQNESIGGGGEEDDKDGEEMQPPGFVPISEAIKAKELVENEVKPEEPLMDTTEIDEKLDVNSDGIENNNDNVADDEEPPKEAVQDKEEQTENPPASENNSTEVPLENGVSESVKSSEAVAEAKPVPLQPPLANGSSRRNSSSSKSNSSSRRNSHANGMDTFLKTGKMDVEA